jgi:hypothetical protein
MLKLPFIYRSKQVKTVTFGNKEVGVLEIFKLKDFLANKQISLQESMKILLNICIEAVKRALILADKIEMRLLNSYNSLTYFKIETLDGHRGSGRINMKLPKIVSFWTLDKNHEFAY